MSSIVSKSTHITSLPITPFEKIELSSGEYIIKQFQRSDYFHLLEDGEVSFHIFLEEEGETFQIGTATEEGTPIGWSGFNQPFRNATTVKVESEKARFIRWKIKDLLEEFRENPLVGIHFLKYVGQNARKLMSAVLIEISKENTIPVYSFDHSDETFQQIDTPQSTLYLKKSPFFESLDDQTLEFFNTFIEIRSYRAGDTIFEQGTSSNGLFILEEGWVDYLYHQKAGNDEILFRSISTPGFVVGWSASLEALNLSTARARRETKIFFLPNEGVEELVQIDPIKAYYFYERLLWLMAHHLQVVRTKFLNIKFNLEQIAIKSLITQNGARLSLHSPLHKVPHLLQSKITRKDAFELLHMLHSEGDSHERHIASLCLDNLQEVEKEDKFYHHLIKTYNTVIHSSMEHPHEKVRQASAQCFNEAMQYSNYTLKGWENLPEQSGNIFIYNHLRNHPHNTLPNNFQITLDAHFISSKVLFNKYGDPGIRVVRIGTGIEYGHQDYYHRLGHIDVYTNESDPLLKSSSYREEKRQEFYLMAGEYLERGLNIIISPEGTSYSTEESPGPFKSGAFRLALSMEREPLIIPVVLLNFDKRVRQNRFICLIKEPFHVSDYVKDPDDRNEMKNFLAHYQETFRKEVEAAIKLYS